MSSFRCLGTHSLSLLRVSKVRPVTKRPTKAVERTVTAKSAVPPLTARSVVAVTFANRGETLDSGELRMEDLLAAASIFAGAALVALQLFLQRRWNIQRSTEEITHRFTEPTMYEHWNLIQPSVVEQRKKWEEISAEEQRSVRILLSYFETVGFLFAIYRRMIIDLFGDVITLLYGCTSNFLPRLRALRQSDAVYAEFEFWARTLSKAHGPKPYSVKATQQSKHAA